MRINMVGAFIRNAPFGTEIAFKKGFDVLGGHTVTCIDTSYPDQKWDYDADFTIVFKWMEGYWDDLKKCKGKKIVYQPDDIRFPHIFKMMTEMRKFCDYALTYDDEAAAIALTLGYERSNKLLLTADPDLYRRLPGVQKDIDVCFVGSLTNGANHQSRVKMCQIVSSLGLRTRFVSDLYDIDDIVRIYNRSKIVLNHATDVGQPFGSGYGYQCRHFEAGFTGACLVSNTTIKPAGQQEIFPFAVFNDEKTLVESIRYLLVEDPSFANVLGEALYQRLNLSHRPEHRAQEILEFVK